MPDPQVLSLATAEGVAYAGTPLGVVEFRDGRRQRTLADGFFARAIARRGATLYVGTQDEGIIDCPCSRGRRRALLPISREPAFSVVRLVSLEGEPYAIGENAIYRYDPSQRQWNRPSPRALPCSPTATSHRWR